MVTDLPRSRALMRLDGPGHIMPVEPVTPHGSTAWRIAHFPVTLGFIAIGLLLLAILGIKLLGAAFQLVTYVPGAWLLEPLIGAGAIVTVYLVFVRVIERRPFIDELGVSGWFNEALLGLGFALALAGAICVAQGVLGELRILGFNPLKVMLAPLVAQLCTAIALELLLRGLCFRMTERLLGSWLALALTVAGYAAIALSSADTTTASMPALVLQSGLICSALYMLTRRLWAAIGFHTAWNLALIGLDGATTSSTGPHGFLLLSESGPDWLTGGARGMESSAPALVFAGLLVLALLATAVRRGRIVRPMWLRGRAAAGSPQYG